jgi:hypothetical protein
MKVPKCVETALFPSATGCHRWACLLKQQMLISLLLADQGNKLRFPFPFEANKRKFAVSVYRLQQTNRSCRYPL